jgi:hypothetical protein
MEEFMGEYYGSQVLPAEHRQGDDLSMQGAADLRDSY